MSRRQQPGTDGMPCGPSAKDMRVAGAVLRVVIYYRMSQDDQTTSIEQQQNDCRAYAKAQGWEIVREYVDPGLSGLLPWEQRAGFLQMLEDCQRLKDVNAVFVWHSSRFGRLDSQLSQQPKILLRQAGMWLESLKEGRIDWSTSMGRIMDTLYSEQNHLYSQTLSANVVRGQRDRAAQGWRSIGYAPYGYDRLYHSPDSTRTMSVKRTERFKAPLKWGLKLVVNEEEAAVVRWIYAEFLAGKSVSFLTRELNRKGLPVPYRHRPTRRFNRGTWGVSTVSDILNNKAYAGYYRLGVEHRKDGLNKLEYAEHAGAIPVLVPLEQWSEVQRLREKMRGRKIKPRTGGGPLNGILYCGNCGLPLYRKMETSGKVNKQRLAYYTCKHGLENAALGCRAWRAREDRVLPVVLETVVQAIDFEAIKALQAKPPKAAGRQLAALETRQRELAADIERGTENLLRANARTFPLLEKRLTELQAELDRVTNALALARSDEPEGNRRARLEWLQSVRGRLVTVIEAEGMAEATPHPCGWPDCGEPPQQVMDVIRAHLGNPPVAGTVYADGKPYRVAVDEDGERTYWEYERDGIDVLGDGSKWYRPAKPAVQLDVAALRSLMLSLGLRVSLTWVPNGKRFYKLHRAEIKADSGERTHSFNSAHGLNGGVAPVATLAASSSSTRGRSPRASCWRRWCSWRWCAGCSRSC